MITQRRVFQAKSGSSGAVVKKMQEFQPIFERAGGPAARIYTDFFSGPTDRVVWEFDVDNLAALENVFWAASQNAEYQAAYESWYAGLAPLLEGATVEIWNREN